jgi:hypothetical protein
VAALALVAGGTARCSQEEEAAKPATPAESKFRSPEDGWLDISGFLDKPYGFLPLLVPITEPAVGYGAAGGLAFIEKNPGDAQAGWGRPDVTAVAGALTQNDTWGLVAADLRHWGSDRLETFVGVVKASVNLDFYGVGEEDDLREDPLSYNLEPLGGVLRGRYRIGGSKVWAGLTYMLAETDVAFDAPAGTPGLPDSSNDSRVGGLTPSITYDSRDNFFTPTRGTFFEGTAGFFDEALGGDSSFQRVGLVWIHQWPLDHRLYLGVRGRAQFSFGDPPFYMLPFISLRGVAILRYQGEEAADVETEMRWQPWKRFSLVGFAGAGAAWNDFAHLDNSIDVLTGGTGFRYEIARRYGIHVGLDVAFGPDNPAIYVIFGSAWARP